MAKAKKIGLNADGTENVEEAKIEKVVNAKPKNERIAFARKVKKMQELVETLEPIEERLMEILVNEKYPIMDQIQLLRVQMVKECVHPKDHLIFVSHATDEYIECKFCNARLVVR